MRVIALFVAAMGCQGTSDVETDTDGGDWPDPAHSIDVRATVGGDVVEFFCEQAEAEGEVEIGDEEPVRYVVFCNASVAGEGGEQATHLIYRLHFWDYDGTLEGSGPCRYVEGAEEPWNNSVVGFEVPGIQRNQGDTDDFDCQTEIRVDDVTALQVPDFMPDATRRVHGHHEALQLVGDAQFELVLDFYLP